MDQIVRRSSDDMKTQNSSTGNRYRLNGSLLRYVIVAIIILIAISAGYMALNNRAVPNNFANAIAKDKYQAIFLTNGQVYFGKINRIDQQGYTLKDIYYLQVQNDTQQQTPATQQKQQVQPDQTQSLSLAKLGNELHGPQDAMYIETRQVIFWENLKDDSKVVKAIQDNSKK